MSINGISTGYITDYETRKTQKAVRGNAFSSRIGQSVNSTRANIKSTEEQTTPTMRKTIGGTTYIVTAHFSETSKETMADKICRMIKRDIESGNYCPPSCPLESYGNSLKAIEIWRHFLYSMVR